jgi:uncharacterized membrane protein YgdD (TMEM256/DUF423 family)
VNQLNETFRDWLLFTCVAIGIPATAIFEVRSSDETKAVVLGSSLFCLLALNVYFAIQLHSRKKRAGKPISKLFWCGVLGMMVFSGGITVWAGSYVSAHNSYLALTLSNKPLKEIYPKRKRLLVELMRNRLANSLENDKAIAEARQHPIAPALYSPESFANTVVIDSVKNQLRKAVETDHGCFLKQQLAMTDFEQKMATVDPAYLRSWKTSRQYEDEAEVMTDQLQMDWFEETNSLYDYSATRLNQISLKNGALVFTNEETQVAFDRQEARCKALLAKLQERVQEEAKTHRKPAI